MISDAAVTAAIMSWLRARSAAASARSPMDGISQVARLGTIVQAGRGNWSPLESVEAWTVRYCTGAHLAALVAKYMPTPPLTRIVNHVLCVRADGQLVTELREVARWATDAEVGVALGVSAAAARSLLIEARDAVRSAVERREREHLSKCE